MIDEETLTDTMSQLRDELIKAWITKNVPYKKWRKHISDKVVCFSVFPNYRERRRMKRMSA